MVSIEAFSELLEVLYSAPLDQEQWQRFLALLSRHTRSGLSFFLCADSRLGLSVRAQAGSDPLDASSVEAYNERYSRSDPFRASLLRRPRTGVFQDEDLLPNRGLLRTELFRDLMGPAGQHYATILILTLSLRRLEAVSLWRSDDAGPMDESSNRLLHLLLPHIQKALEIRQVLGVTQQQLAGAEAMMDASATATLLLCADGRVLHRNAAAGLLLEQRVPPLILEEGRLLCAEPRLRNDFSRFLRSASVPFASSTASPLPHALTLQRGSRQPLQLLASPLPASQRARSGADLVLLITDPERPANFPDTVLHALYRLTSAETEVANGLLTGYTLEEIASLRRVSIGTVRQQVKTILGKTGTSRQSDLVRLLMALPRSFAAD